VSSSGSLDWKYNLQDSWSPEARLKTSVLLEGMKESLIYSSVMITVITAQLWSLYAVGSTKHFFLHSNLESCWIFKKENLKQRQFKKEIVVSELT